MPSSSHYGFEAFRLFSLVSLMLFFVAPPSAFVDWWMASNWICVRSQISILPCLVHHEICLDDASDIHLIKTAEKMSLESEAEEKVFFTQAKMVWTQMLLKSSSIPTFCWLWPQLSCFYMRLWLFWNFLYHLGDSRLDRTFLPRQVTGDENSPKRITKLNEISEEFVAHFLIFNGVQTWH